MRYRFQSVESTQNEAHALAARGVAAGAAVVAVEQTRGRGTRGRAWAAGPGGLWLSVILRPSHAPAVENQSVRVGLAVADALGGLHPTVEPLLLKWPNDLIARDRKLGGILVEVHWLGSEPQWMVVGLGLNVRNRLDPALAATAIRLADLVPDPEPEPLVEPMIAAIVGAAACGGPLTPDELARFRSREWPLGAAPGLGSR